jgi:hypothetical protein
MHMLYMQHPWDILSQNSETTMHTVFAISRKKGVSH